MFTFERPVVTEIVPDVFRFSLFAPQIDLQFNYFVVRDEEPLLFTTGLRCSFELLKSAVSEVLDPASIRWIGFSHFESDECGALNDWLAAAPNAQPVCGVVGAMVNINDFASRPARAMEDGEVLETGSRRFQFCATAQLPHGWDAGLLHEQTSGTLFCSDLFHQMGDVEAVTTDDLTGRARAAMAGMQASPLADYIPYNARTDRVLKKLATLKPKTLAIMHGSSYIGDGERALLDLADAMRETLGEP